MNGSSSKDGLNVDLLVGERLIWKLNGVEFEGHGVTITKGVMFLTNYQICSEQVI